jgi:putative flavoprotein involved in K+ transport
MRARAVVVCTGAYQRPHRPPIEGAFPSALLVIDAEQYTNPGALPAGRVLVVGSGQTGCQIAEELQEAGRDVALACGRAPWAPRRFNGRDLVSWLAETSWFDTPLAGLPSPAARLAANLQATGRGGGHDLNYRTLQALRVQLCGRLAAVDDRRAVFADDLAEAVAFGDARYADVRNLLNTQLPAAGLPAPDLPDPPPFRAESPHDVDLGDFGTVIFTSGFRPDYARWIEFPAFDEMGFPLTDDGASRVVPGLYFCGVHFLRTRRSSLLFGVGDDAVLVAGAVAAQLKVA